MKQSSTGKSADLANMTTPSPTKHQIQQTDKTYKNKVIKEGIKGEKNIYIYEKKTNGTSRN